jgi:hypothetical protein
MPVYTLYVAVCASVHCGFQFSPVSILHYKGGRAKRASAKNPCCMYVVTERLVLRCDQFPYLLSPGDGEFAQLPFTQGTKRLKAYTLSLLMRQFYPDFSPLVRNENESELCQYEANEESGNEVLRVFFRESPLFVIKQERLSDSLWKSRLTRHFMLFLAKWKCETRRVKY